MRIQNAGYFARLLEQVALGKTLQCQSSSGEWWNITANTEVSFTGDPNTWRIKPEPKLRPWKPEEVPVGVAVRSKNSNNRYVITYVGMNGEIRLAFAGHPHIDSQSPSSLLDSYEHSTDHGKTWLPCGVMEEV